ncbi:MAG: hypothetical protein L6R36_004335 [Xanthoria steineri]|nr:MAG: hypothetical protein L6R36_004335 [Xanthoria steineri]
MAVEGPTSIAIVGIGLRLPGNVTDPDGLWSYSQKGPAARPPFQPTEAQALDPQQWILLETTYDAFQSSGSTLESVRGSNTAVYIATFSSDYDRNIQKDTDDIPKYYTTGTGEAIAANRLSDAFDLRGPSVALDTGCCGSLVAVHYACQSLITGDVETAIAGGVNLIMSPDRMMRMANLGYVGEWF